MVPWFRRSAVPGFGFGVALIFAGQLVRSPQSAVDATRTPTACLEAVKAAMAAGQKQLAAAPPSISAARSADGKGLAAGCTARFDLATAKDTELPALIELYRLAIQADLLRTAIERAVKSTSLPPPDHAGVLVQAVQLGLTDPQSAERDGRLEAFVAQLDKLPNTVALAQKITAHQRMSVGYQKDGHDDAVERHASWIVNASKTCTLEQQKQFTSAIVGAYLNLSAAWAADGQPARAIALLKGAPAALPGIPSVARSVTSDIDRLELVGTAAAPIAAAHWLNVPAGTTAFAMKGHVTLLEFSAHWCVPCKKSYPAVNRFREKYGPLGFRVVMATQLYGYFERETGLSASTEIERDKAYFASHHLDVPIAINNEASADEDPNGIRYRVLGLPQIVIVDRQGVIRYLTVGYSDGNEASMARVIGQLLK